MSGQVKVITQVEEAVLNIAAEPLAVYGNVKVKDCSSVDTAILAGYIIHKNKNKEFGRVKLMKELYLTEQLCELNLHSNFYRNTAGPYDENLVNNAESMLNRYKYYRTEKQWTRNGHTLVCYKEQSAAFEIMQLFEQNFAEKKELIDSLLDKLCKLTGDMNEIIATLFAVWNNRLIRKQSISDEVLLQDFYDWSEHKRDFPEKLVLKALGFMREENIIPSGCGKYIDSKAA
jgi:type I restriction enzyme S subunit